MSARFTIQDIQKTACGHLNQHLLNSPNPVKKNKFKNTPTEFNGRKFQSLKEGTYYIKLLMLLKAGEITDLRLQVPYELNHGGTHSLKYLADFVYLEKGKEIVTDVKGFRTREYKKKKALMLKVYGIMIKEI